MNDNVYSIRMAAIDNFKELTRIFGSTWAEKNILKKLIDMRLETNYLYRLTALFGISELSQVVNTTIIKKHFVPLL